MKPNGWRMIGHNASEGIEPEIFIVALGQGPLSLEASNAAREMVSASRRAGV